MQFNLESPTIEDFGKAVGMSDQEVENLKLILFSVEQGDVGILHSLGIRVRRSNFHRSTLSYVTIVKLSPR